MNDPNVRIRLASAADLDALRRALAHAIDWRSPALAVPAADHVRDTGHDYLLEGWGREGDAAVVAEVETRVAGVAWYRFWDDTEHSYGYVDAATPEVGVGVDPDLRGRGVGTALLTALLDTAAQRGVGRLSLSVEGENPAAHLYQRLGFVRVAQVEASWTMVKELRRPPREAG